MLQIITEKFFKPGERYTTLHRAIFYTNYRLMRGEKIETPIATLLPSTGLHPLPTLTCEMTEKQEKFPFGGDKPGAFVATTGDDLMNDFAAVVSFFLNVTCTADPDLTRRLLSPTRSLGIHTVPSQLVRRMFDKDVHGKEGEAEALSQFVRQLIGLERKTFGGAMRSIRQFITGSHRIADNLSLAYVMLVMSMESLAQQFDGHVAEWADYEPMKRMAIDHALDSASQELVQRVRTAILSNEHVAAARRFRDFALAHVNPAFFREETAGVLGPVSRNDLSIALQQAYNVRSKYVHTLSEVPPELTDGHFPEAVDHEGRKTLTLAGLARLSRHILMQFVWRGKTVSQEEFDYRGSIPGIIRVEMAPRYWVANVNGFNKDTAPKRLGGFLSEIADLLTNVQGATLTDLTPLLEKAEQLVSNLSKPRHRLPILALQFLFHQFTPEKYHRPNWRNMFEQYQGDFSEPSIESFVCHLLTDQKPDWTLFPVEELHRTYFRTRHIAKVTEIGRLFEAAFSLHLAEMNRAVGFVHRARELIAFAVEAHPGSTSLQNFEASLPAELPQITWKKVLLPPPSPKSEEAKPTPTERAS